MKIFNLVSPMFRGATPVVENKKAETPVQPLKPTTDTFQKSDEPIKDPVQKYQEELERKRIEFSNLIQKPQKFKRESIDGEHSTQTK